MIKHNKFILLLLISLLSLIFQSCGTFIPQASSEETSRMSGVIPKPLFAESTGNVFTITKGTAIKADPGIEYIAKLLASELNPATGFSINVSGERGDIELNINENDISLGEEGYLLIITSNKLELSAYKPAGLFYGIQTIKQLLPPEIESSSATDYELKIPTGVIRDNPRFEWRGTMLDVARHFFSVEDVKKYIDLLSFYKLNRFHMHLSDDQGWRIEIKSWPKLTEIGGSSSVNNEKPGYYTQEEYTDIVKYAAERFITVVPEIDMPGHTHAALVSYPELSCDDSVRKPYTGIEVGFSSLCINKDITYKFINDVIRELSAITPGKYIHIGGDEASATDSAEYIQFITKVQDIVNVNGKSVVGWEEISQSALKKSSLVQLWRGAHAKEAVIQDVKIIMSPASKIYLDMKYDSTKTLGLNWAGYVNVRTAYDWHPDEYIEGINEFDIIGIEAPLWSETITTLDHIEYLAFPQLPGVAELAWSQKNNRNWEEYKLRLGKHAPRFKAMGINYYESPEIEWEE